MTWDHSHESNESGLMITPLTGRQRRVGRKRVDEWVTLGASELVSGFTWELSFNHPDTLTEEEAREEYDSLVHRVMTSQGPALTRCLMIIGNLPEPLLPTVLDQLQEIAEHETRTWRFRMDHGDKPSIGEDIRVLPVGRE